MSGCTSTYHLKGRYAKFMALCDTNSNPVHISNNTTTIIIIQDIIVLGVSALYYLTGAGRGFGHWLQLMCSA